MTKFGTLELVNGKLVEKDVMHIDINQMPSSDPLAFAAGIHAGQRELRYKNENRTRRSFEEVHGSKYSELAQEYLRGFLFGFTQILVPEGTKIRKGQESCFALHHLNTYKK